MEYIRLDGDALEHIRTIAESLDSVARQQYGEMLDHVFGPCQADFSLANGVHALASSLDGMAHAQDRIATALEELVAVVKKEASTE